jgi:hypothetical protein
MCSKFPQLGLMLTIVSLLTLQSCATVFTGTRDIIHFDSKPAGAKVRIDGIDMGRTPLDVSVKRSINDKAVTMQLDGYETRTFVLSKEFNFVSVLNLFGMIGWAVDAVTGALMYYDMKQYTVELEPAKR